MSAILIIGGASAMAQCVARILAGRKDTLYLVDRNEAALGDIAEDLKVHGAAEVHTEALDLTETDKHEALVARAEQALGGIDTVLIAHGVLGKQDECEKDFAKAQEVIDVNFTSAASLLTILGNRFEEKKSGVIAVISSVAGDRGRKNNYVYGASKAAKSAFLSGLRGRLAPAGVTVLTIKPGQVDTPMTKDFDKKGFLWAKPEAVARGIVKAIDKRKDVVYLPFFWFWIMTIIKHIPERIFKKLSI